MDNVVNLICMLRIFTWHIHGTYLYYLSLGEYEIYIPVKEDKEEGYYGRGETFPFGKNVIEIPVEEVKNYEFDCILFQTNKNYLKDQYEILTEEQRKLPRIYLEHDPPTKDPTEQLHIMRDPEVLMVHVTYFNKLMWNNDGCEVKVIEHGAPDKKIKYTGTIEKGIVVINHLHQRGRKTGADIFKKVSTYIPLDLIGMGTFEYGGLGEVLHPQMASFISQYRFFFNPIRYTSFGLAVCEAMMVGMPVVALATTEYSAVISNGVSGIIHTDVDYLIEKMNLLLQNKALAVSLGEKGRRVARKKFDIERFTNEWKLTFEMVINKTKKITNDKKENSVC